MDGEQFCKCGQPLPSEEKVTAPLLRVKGGEEPQPFDVILIDGLDMKNVSTPGIFTEA